MLLPERMVHSSYMFTWSLYALKCDLNQGEQHPDTVEALFQLLLLTDYFRDSPLESRQVLRLMRRFQRILDANSFAIEQPEQHWIRKQQHRRRNSGKIAAPPLDSTVPKCQIGTGLYLWASLFNHSCDPNAAFVFEKNSIRMFATRIILPGEVCKHECTFHTSAMKECKVHA